MSAPLTDTERAAILSDLQAGMSQCAAAKKHKRSKSTVNGVAQSAGIDAERSATEKATAARKDYDLAARLELVNDLFDKVRDLLPSAVKPGEVHSLVMSAAVLIDKRRLEDGDATSRTELSDAGARERIARRVDELALRRRARDAATGTDG